MHERTIAVILAALFAANAAAAEEIVFKSGTMEFDKVGPIQAAPGDTLKLLVRDDDPRRRWQLQLEYSEPLADRTKVDADILKTVLAGGVVPRAAATSRASGVTGEAQGLEAEAAALASAVAAFLAASTAAPAALTVVEKAAHKIDDARMALAAKRAGATPAEQQAIDPALAKASAAYALSVEVQHWCKTSAAREFPFTVHPGNRRLAIRACYQQLEIGSDRVSVSAREPTCSRGYYDLSILEPASGPRVIVGALIPIYAKRPREFFLDSTRGDALTMSKTSAPTGDVEAALFATARRQLNRSRWGVGPEVGFGVGERLGELYSLGVGIDYWGIGIGLGVALDSKGSRETIPGATTGTALDRTRDSSLVSWYIRIGISSDLWDAVSRASGGGGPVNVAQQAPEPALSTGKAAPEN